MPIRCAFCEEWNLPFANFCGSCGNPVFDGIELPSPPEALPRQAATVTDRRPRAQCLTETRTEPVQRAIPVAGPQSLSPAHHRRPGSSPARRFLQGVQRFIAQVTPPPRVQRVLGNTPVMLFLLALIVSALFSSGFAPIGQPVASAEDFTPSASSPSSASAFPDIPADHPVYRAWKSLLGLGIHPMDSSGCASPRSPLAWDDWKKVVFLTFIAFPIPQEAQRMFPGNGHGTLSGRQLSDQLRLLARFWRIAPPASEFEGTSTPDRLEAFAALSRLLTKVRGR